jgi:hypothetical protein
MSRLTIVDLSFFDTELDETNQVCGGLISYANATAKLKMITSNNALADDVNEDESENKNSLSISRFSLASNGLQNLSFTRTIFEEDLEVSIVTSQSPNSYTLVSTSVSPQRLTISISGILRVSKP